MAGFVKGGLDALLSKLVGNKPPTKGEVAKKTILGWLRDKAPPFLQGVLRFVTEGAQNAVTKVAAFNASVVLTLAETLAAMPLLLVAFYAVVVFGAIFTGKFLLYGAPLLLGLAVFDPSRVRGFLALFLTLTVFPLVFGAFLSLSMRTLFLQGVKAQVEKAGEYAQKAQALEYLSNPAMAFMGGAVAQEVVAQVENLLACKDGAKGAQAQQGSQEGLGLVSPYGYILQGRESSSSGPVLCYPSYDVGRFLGEDYRVPERADEIRGEALAIAKALSLDVATLRDRERKVYLLPKGSPDGRMGDGRFRQNGLYGTVGFEEFFPTSFLNTPAGRRVVEVAGIGSNPGRVPLEVGALAKQALEVYVQPSEDGMRELLGNLREFFKEAEALVAKGEALRREGTNADLFYKRGVYWEVAWNFAPSLIAHEMGRGLVEKLREGETAGGPSPPTSSSPQGW